MEYHVRPLKFRGNPDETEFVVKVDKFSQDKLLDVVLFKPATFKSTLHSVEFGNVTCLIQGRRKTFTLLSDELNNVFYIHSPAIGAHIIHKHTKLPIPAPTAEKIDGIYKAKLAGTILKILVTVNEKVKSGQGLLISLTSTLDPGIQTPGL